MKNYKINGKDVRKLIEIYNSGKSILCQFTGLTDKNENKIFEGDILKIYQKSDGLGTYFSPPKDIKQNVIVYWDLICFSWKDTDKEYYWNFPNAWCHYIGEIIGNKFENPELVEIEE